MGRKKTSPATVVRDRAAAVAATLEEAVGRKAGNVAIELARAAVQVLQKEYNWTPAETDVFLQKLLAQGKANRDHPAPPQALSSS